MRPLSDRLISAARSAWYRWHEPEQLRLHRQWHQESEAKKRRIDHDLWEFGNRNPRVSVLIPTFNRVSLLLTRALPSVLNQTYTNLEIIVADHGSSDTTASLTYDTGKSLVAVSDPRVCVIHVPRRRTYPPTAENHWLAGPVDPLNAALKVARGAWLARVDDDDRLAPDHIESLLRFAQSGNYEFVSAAHETPDGKVAPYVVDGVQIGGCQTWLYRSYLRFFRYNIDCHRKARDRVNDVDLQVRMRSAGVRMGYLDKVLAYIEPRPGERYIGSRAYRDDERATEDRYAFR